MKKFRPKSRLSGPGDSVALKNLQREKSKGLKMPQRQRFKGTTRSTPDGVGTRQIRLKRCWACRRLSFFKSFKINTPTTMAGFDNLRIPARTCPYGFSRGSSTSISVQEKIRQKKQENADTLFRVRCHNFARFFVSAGGVAESGRIVCTGASKSGCTHVGRTESNGAPRREIDSVRRFH